MMSPVRLAIGILLIIPAGLYAQTPARPVLEPIQPPREQPVIPDPNRVIQPAGVSRPTPPPPCDLIINANPALETTGTVRKLRVVIRNFGEGSSRDCQLAVRYSWRVDRESASATQLDESFPVEALRPSGQAVVLVTIPDERLRSIRQFGSTQAVVTLLVDARTATNDSNRANNQQTTQIPIVNRQ